MAKGDVTLRFDADTAAAVQNILRARQAVQDSANTSRDFGATAKKAGDDAGASFEDMAGSAAKAAGGIAMSFVGIGGAISAFTTDVTAAYDLMEEKAAHLQETMKAIQDATFKTGVSPMMTPQIDAMLQSKAAAAGLPPDLLRASYTQISQTVGGKAGNPEATEKLIDDSLDAQVNAIKGGMSPESSSQFGSLYANLRLHTDKIESMKNAPNSEIQELAYQVQKSGAQLDDPQFALLERSSDPRHMLDLIMASARTGERSKTVMAAMAELETPISKDEIDKIQARANPQKTHDEIWAEKLSIARMENERNKIFEEHGKTEDWYIKQSEITAAEQKLNTPKKGELSEADARKLAIYQAQQQESAGGPSVMDAALKNPQGFLASAGQIQAISDLQSVLAKTPPAQADEFKQRMADRSSLISNDPAAAAAEERRISEAAKAKALEQNESANTRYAATQTRSEANYIDSFKDSSPAIQDLYTNKFAVGARTKIIELVDALTGGGGNDAMAKAQHDNEWDIAHRSVVGANAGRTGGGTGGIGSGINEADVVANPGKYGLTQADVAGLAASMAQIAEHTKHLPAIAKTNQQMAQQNPALTNNSAGQQ